MPEIINAEGRFKLLTAPMAFPFTDIVNNTPDGPVFDLGVDLDFRSGVVYITADHVEEMARMLGMVHGEEIEALREENKRLEEEKTRLPEGVDDLVNGINQLVVDYNQRAILGTLGHELSNIQVPSDNGTKEKPKSGGKSDKANGQSSSASKHEGADELSGSTVDEFGFDL